MLHTTPQYFSRSPEQFGGKIPFIVTDLIDQLKILNAKDLEGIFRLSGSAREISDLANALDQGRVKDWSRFSNINTIACTLKKYFRDMIQYDALFPYENFQEFISIPSAAKTEEEAVIKYKNVLCKMTKVRYSTFVILFRYLHEISLSPTSKMNDNNLSIVIAPNLIAPGPGKQTSEVTLQYNKQQNSTVAMMIRLSDKIFENAEIDEKLFIKDEDLEVLAPPPISVRDLPRIIELRNIRKNSLIPFVPYELMNDPNFVRPNRVVNFADNE